MVNLYKLELTILQQEILRFLSLNSGKEFNAREISLELEVSQPAVKKALPKLKKREFIVMEKDKRSGRFSIKLDLNQKKVIDFKRVENLRVLYDSGLMDYFKERFVNCDIFLFGDYAFGEDVLSSKINMAMVGNSEKKLVNLNRFEKILNREISLYFYKNWNMEKEEKNRINNGILLKKGDKI